jgi:hypothetical protein
MALIPSFAVRGSRFRLGIPESITRDQLYRIINPSETLAANGPDQLIANAVVWVSSSSELLGDSLRPMMIWCLARDAVGALAAIEDPAYYADPPLLRSCLDRRSSEEFLCDWVTGHANWHAAVDCFCAARRRKALAELAGADRIEGGIRRAM